MQKHAIRNSSARLSNSHKGFETWSADVRMQLKMHAVVISIFLGIQLAAGFLIVLVRHSELLAVGLRYLRAAASAMKMPDSPVFFDALAVFAADLTIGFIFTLPVWYWYPRVVRFFARRAERDSATEHLSGTEIVPLGVIRKQTENHPSTFSIMATNEIPVGAISVDEVKELPASPLNIPREIETRHFFFVGASGSGKSATISQMIQGMADSGHFAIIHDPDGEYTSQFYDPSRDVIFNPLDERGVGWTLFNDLDNETDYKQVAGVLIPDAKRSADPIWSTGARQILEGILGALTELEERPTNARLWSVIESGPEGIASFLSKSSRWQFAASTYLSDPSSKMSLSFVATLAAWSYPLKYLPDGDFSIKQSLEHREGFVFLTNREDLKPTLRPLLSLFLELFGARALSLPPDPDSRFYIVVDELGALHKLRTLTRLPVQIRKRGGSLILGVQDFGQLDDIYGKSLRKSIVNSCGSTLILSVSDEDTAGALSRRIGEREFREANESQSGGPEDSRAGFNIGRQRKIEKAVLGSHIMNLPTLQGYLKLSGLPFTKLQVVPRDYEQREAGFIMREDLASGQITAASEGAREVLDNMEDSQSVETEGRAKLGAGKQQELSLDDFL